MSAMMPPTTAKVSRIAQIAKMVPMEPSMESLRVGVSRVHRGPGRGEIPTITNHLVF
jgi:hypothetical protein